MRTARLCRLVAALVVLLAVAASLVSCIPAPQVRTYYYVSGRVTLDGDGLPGVTLLFTGNHGHATTNAEGLYSKASLTGTVTVIPSLSDTPSIRRADRCQGQPMTSTSQPIGPATTYRAESLDRAAWDSQGVDQFRRRLPIYRLAPRVLEQEWPYRHCHSRSIIVGYTFTPRTDRWQEQLVTSIFRRLCHLQCIRQSHRLV